MHDTMAKGRVTAQRKNDAHSQAMLLRIARNLRFFGTSRGVESETFTAICNPRMYQSQPYIQVIMRAVERPSRCYTFLQEFESINMSFCNQRLTCTPKKRNYKDIFPQPSRNLPSASTKISKTSRIVY